MLKETVLNSLDNFHQFLCVNGGNDFCHSDRGFPSSLPNPSINDPLNREIFVDAPLVLGCFGRPGCETGAKHEDPKMHYTIRSVEKLEEPEMKSHK